MSPAQVNCDPPRKIKFEFHFLNFRSLISFERPCARLRLVMQRYKLDQLVFPNTLIYVWQPDTISTLTATNMISGSCWQWVVNIHRSLPAALSSHTHKRDFSHIFCNFQTFLEAFFHKRSILTNLVNFWDKP